MRHMKQALYMEYKGKKYVRNGMHHIKYSHQPGHGLYLE